MKKIDKIIEFIRAQGVEIDGGPEDKGWFQDEGSNIVWIGLAPSALEADHATIRAEIEKVADFLDAAGHLGYVDGVCKIYNADEHTHLENAVLEEAFEKLLILAAVLGYE